MKIMVPLDLSNTASKALQPAVDVARGLGDEILLVTVGGLRLRGDLLDVAETEHVSVPDMIENHLRSTAAEIEGVETSFQMIPGDDAADSLIDFASSDHSIRMIVMATHGRSGLERWRLGSVTERVVRHSELPVLVVPARKKG